ncbi:MAG: response regulator transcription factor, partial [Candidatus Dormibacteraceae bacterium]
MTNAGESAQSALDDYPKVLLVEDDAVIAQMYRMKLEMDGYLVDIAPDGVSGLSMAKESQPDVIFLDIRLPGMGGLA